MCVVQRDGLLNDNDPAEVLAYVCLLHSGLGLGRGTLINLKCGKLSAWSEHTSVQG